MIGSHFTVGPCHSFPESPSLLFNPIHTYVVHALICHF